MDSEELAALHRLRTLLGDRLVVMGRAEMSYSNGEISQLIGAIDLVDDVMAKWEKLAIVRPATTKGQDPTDRTVPSVDTLKLGNPCIANEWPIRSVPTMGVSFFSRAEPVSCPRCGTIHQCLLPHGTQGL